MLGAVAAGAVGAVAGGDEVVRRYKDTVQMLAELSNLKQPQEQM